MKKTVIALIAAAVGLGAASAQATPIRLDGPEANLQTIINGLSGNGAGTNVVTDQVSLDEAFSLSGFIGVGSIVVEHAGFSNLNAFGIYDVLDQSKRLEIFSGSAGAGSMSFFLPPDSFSSGLFGFYLETPRGCGSPSQQRTRMAPITWSPSSLTDNTSSVGRISPRAHGIRTTTISWCS
jgi:hypothetical protein